jgi:hypothetical protein
MARNESIPSQEAVGAKMGRMPDKVSETYRTKLGTYRGLEAGIILHPLGGTEVYLDGAVRCREQLMRDNPGPRAVLNALERLSEGYDYDIRHLKAEIAVKAGQLRDFETRLGKPFAHEEFKSELTDLRDRLKLGLSEHPPEDGESVVELAEKIKTLRESVTVEAAPVRVGTRKAAQAERPVTARIRERLAEAGEGKAELAAAEPVAPAAIEAKPEPVEPPALVIPMPEPVKRVADYRQAVTRRRQGNETQLRLF